MEVAAAEFSRVLPQSASAPDMTKRDPQPPAVKRQPGPNIPDSSGPPTSPPMAPALVQEVDYLHAPEPIPCASPQQLPRSTSQLPLAAMHSAPVGYTAASGAANEGGAPSTVFSWSPAGHAVTSILNQRRGDLSPVVQRTFVGSTRASPAPFRFGSVLAMEPSSAGSPSVQHSSHACSPGRRQPARRKRSRVGVLSHSPARYSSPVRSSHSHSPATGARSGPRSSPASFSSMDYDALDAHDFSALRLLHLAAQTIAAQGMHADIQPDIGDDAHTEALPTDTDMEASGGRPVVPESKRWRSAPRSRPSRRTSATRRKRSRAGSATSSTLSKATSSKEPTRTRVSPPSTASKRRRRSNSGSSQCRNYVCGGPDDPRHYFLQVHATSLTAEQFAKLESRVQNQAHSGKKGRYYCASAHVCTGCKEVFKGGAPLFRRNELVQDNLYRALRLQACLDVGMKPLSVGAGAGNHHNHNRDGRKGPCSVAARMKRLMAILEDQVED